MTNLIITRGVPGCGKTTRAKKWVAKSPAHRARINRDDLRETMHGGSYGNVTEAQVTAVQHAGVLTLLRAGISVVVDDTNSNPATMATLRLLGVDAGAEVTMARPETVRSQVEASGRDTTIERHVLRSNRELFQLARVITQKSAASPGLIKYWYGSVKYPPSPHPAPHELRTRNREVASSYPTARTA